MINSKQLYKMPAREYGFDFEDGEIVMMIDE